MGVGVCGGLWVGGARIFGCRGIWRLCLVSVLVFWLGLEEHKGINNLCFDKACEINNLDVFIFVIFRNILNMFSNLNFDNNHDILII